MSGAGDKGEAGFKVCLCCGKIVAEGDSFCSSCGSDLRMSSGGGPGAVDGASFLSTRTEGGALADAGRGARPSPPGVTGIPFSPGGTHPPASPVYHAPPGPPPFGYRAAFYQPAKNDDLAVFSLVCAVISFTFLPFVPAVAALVMGFMSLGRIRRSGGMLRGRGFALAGIIVGALNLVLFLVLVLLLVTGQPDVFSY